MRFGVAAILAGEDGVGECRGKGVAVGWEAARVGGEGEGWGAEGGVPGRGVGAGIVRSRWRAPEGVFGGEVVWAWGWGWGWGLGWVDS